MLKMIHTAAIFGERQKIESRGNALAQHSRNSLTCFSRQRSCNQRVDCLMDDTLLDILGIWGRYITTQIQCTFKVACRGLVPEASLGPKSVIIFNILNNWTCLFISINRKIYIFLLKLAMGVCYSWFPQRLL
jgi:hypothetical protein